MDKFRIRKKIISKSIFTRTVLTFSLMSLVTLIALFLVVNNLVMVNQRERFQAMTASQLNRVEADMDTRLEGIRKSMRQFLYSSDVISMMVKVNMSDTELTANIVHDLGGFAGEDELVSEAALYLPTREIVFTSSRGNSANFVQLENYAYREVIDQFLETRESERPRGEDICFRSMILKGQIFLISDFCVPNFLGAMVLRLDMDEFQQIIQGAEGVEVGRYFLYAAAGRQLLDSGAWSGEILEGLQNGETYDIGTGHGDEDSLIYCKASAVEGVVYGIYRDVRGERVALGSLILAFMPVLIIYALFAAVYSTYISRNIYKPINRLLQITMNRRAVLDEVRRHQARDEMEYLEEAFRDTWGENRQNRAFLANISQDMVEQTFRSIMAGRPVEPAYVQNTFQGLGLPHLASGRYMAIALFLEAPEDREKNSLEIGMYRRSLVTFVEDFKGDIGTYTALAMDQEQMAVAACFREDATANAIKQEIGELLQQMEEYTAQLPFTILSGTGRICNDIMSLRISFQEAHSQIEYKRYVGNEPESKEAEAADAIPDYNRSYFVEQAEQLAEIAEKERRENAEQRAASLITEILSGKTSDWKGCLNMVMGVLAEKMIVVHVPSGEMKQLNAAVDRSAALTDVDLREERLTKALFDVVKAIYNNSRKSRYRYVDAAKEYIVAHYADGNLTLNEVSDAVGISAPYLSGIFAESEDIGFASYLSNYRVEQAKQFLEQTTQSVTDIGYKCGFNSAQSFSRVFKKNTGFTPGQYRERCRGSAEGGGNGV